LSLVQLGVDSVSAIKLASVMKVELNADIPLANLFSQDASISRLAGLLSMAKTKQDSLDLNKDAKSIDWIAECELPLSLKESLRSAKVESVDKQLAAPRAILLTGAAGFIGAFLVESLLKQYPNSRLVALIRAANDQLARERVISSLTKYRINLTDSELSKLEVVRSICEQLCLVLTKLLNSAGE